MLPSVTFNWGAILVAAVITMILGWLWYSPMMFGKSWMKLMDIKEMKPNPKALLGMFVVAVLIAYMLTFFVVYAGAITFGVGFELGIMAAIGFVVLTMASGTLASGMNWKLWAINSGYWVVALALMGGVLAAMR